MAKNNTRIRIIVAVAVIALITIGFATNGGIGTISAFGWSDISILCPLGALGTMLASKLFVPRAVIALVIVIVLIILLGRAFCAWACPVPLLQRIRGLFGKPAKPDAEAADDENLETAGADTTASGIAALSAAEAASLKGGCGSCAEKRGKLDSRHFILGGSLLSAAIFGFPVFCLVCPIGLTFAFILLVMRLFGSGDVTWSLVIIPLILIVELLVFRKWCSKLCPLAAFMSLFGFLNRTFRPQIDDSKCLVSAKGTSCTICAKVCPEGIDPRRPEESPVGMNECTKCRECVVNCPTQALKMPLLPKAKLPAGNDNDKQEEQAA
ncbi:MAG: 4Fe-4S binding protein [Coriobacteriales bacterium]|jgi:ferredoxin-type protein NapH|nr:4Fe-4S binding protein [Coriobacteriales bacterium]